MADVNFPDVLGAVTGGVRASLDVLHVAAAIRPRPLRVGRPFDIALILQNACDQRLDLSVTLALPETDALKKRGRFVCAQPWMKLTLQPAEVAVVLFPATSQPDTAPGAYKARLTIEGKPAMKPRRIRHANGGGAFEPSDLPASVLPVFNTLRGLNYSVGKAHGRGMEVSLALAVGEAAGPLPPDERKTRSLSVWRAPRAAQTGAMLHLYGPLLRSRLLPQCRRDSLVPVLVKATHHHFEQAGYPLQAVEASLIAKVMGLLLEYGAPEDTGHGLIAAGRWAVTPLINRGYDPAWSPPVPNWVRVLLQVVEDEPRAVGRVAAVMAGPAYTALIRDAVLYGFDYLAAATGEDMGTPAERSAYADDVVTLLEQKQGMDFSRAFLPLVMAGILINDLLLLPSEKPSDLLHGLARALELREPDLLPEEIPVLDMTTRLLDRVALKYGFRVLP